MLICKASHFRGGTITWKPTDNLYEAEFTYRLGWRYSAGHGCSETLVNQYVNTSSSSWRCTSGCSSQINIANYGYSSSAWISLDYQSGGGSWSLQTTVEFGMRSDTRLPNHIPTSTGKPTYTILYGCTETITIPVLDDDNDNTRCRWANSSSECASSNCSLTIRANHTAGGTYAVAIMVEDYPKTTITIGNRTYTPNDVISASPYQFLVVTPNDSSRTCNEKPKFVTPTPVQSSTVSVVAGNMVTLSYYATSTGTTIVSMLVIGPPGVTRSTLQLDPSRNGVYYINVSWLPTVNDIGSATLCVEATDALGINSDLHCLTLDVTDINECDSNPCMNGATCSDLFNEYLCECADGYTGTNCQIDINECDFQDCLNGGTCIDTVGVAVCDCKPDINECDFQDCLNGDINECDFQDCLNGGTCIDTVGVAVCDCKLGFTGTVYKANR
ncbi:hypothetical protein ACF0H5_002340 [Mactra antiquata]